MKYDFITVCKEKFGDMYSFEKTKYVNSKTNVIITDKNGNDLCIKPSALLRRNVGKRKNKYTTDYVIKKSKEIFGNNTYNYDKTVCNNSTDYITITCPKHGDFTKQAYVHLNSRQGCPYCSDKRLNMIKFLEKAHEVHGDRYDYSKVEYSGCNEKICIICPEHGEFWQTTNGHLGGNGCPKCQYKNSRKKIEDFIEDSKIDERNISIDKDSFIGMDKYAIFMCKECGFKWNAKPSKIQQGQGCPKCAKHIPLTTEDFIEKANKIHNNKFIYSKTNIIRMSKKVIITCPKHGDFEQEPFRHLKGEGCPICKESKLEKQMAKILEKNNIKFERNKKYPFLKNDYCLSYDFYLPEYNILIECQGRQHFKSINFFGGNIAFERQQINDHLKYNFAINNNIKILYYTNLNYNTFKGEILYKDEKSLLKEIKGV